MGYDAWIYNLQSDPGVRWSACYARPWLLPCGTESWLARTPWVLGFFSGRVKPFVLWGGTGERPLEKRERGLPELLMVLAVNLKENYLLDPCVVFLATRSGECRFSSGKTCARTYGPPERETPLRGEHQKVWCELATGESPSPSTGLGRWSKMPQRDQLRKERGSKRAKKKRKAKTKQEEKYFPIKMIYPNLEYRQYLE